MKSYNGTENYNTKALRLYHADGLVVKIKKTNKKYLQKIDLIQLSSAI